MVQRRIRTLRATKRRRSETIVSQDEMLNRERRESDDIDPDLSELLALLDEPLDERIVERGVANLCAFLQRKGERSSA